MPRKLAGDQVSRSNHKYVVISISSRCKGHDPGEKEKDAPSGFWYRSRHSEPKLFSFALKYGFAFLQESFNSFSVIRAIETDLLALGFDFQGGVQVSG